MDKTRVAKTDVAIERFAADDILVLFEGLKVVARDFYMHMFFEQSLSNKLVLVGVFLNRKNELKLTVLSANVVISVGQTW